jgi:outer membrane protein insertion porin family
LTWMSPVGPIAISYGYPLVDKSGDDTQAIQFLLGAGF